MTQPGGAVAIWHDIAPDGLAEFYAWHGEEHMPERVAIPGFLRGRRFIATRADLGFFNLYETASPDVVGGPAYKLRLDNPTPRTLSAVRHFRNVARALCRVVASRTGAQSGIAQGGLVATLRYDVDAGSEVADLTILEHQIMPRLAAEAGVAALSLLAADRVASGYVNAEQRARGAANLVPPIVLVVEGWADEASFVQAVELQLGSEARKKAGLSGIGQLGFYRHQLTINR